MKKGLLLLLILGLTACETVAYYTQAFHGQFTILTQRRDIEDVVQDPETDNQLRSQLQTVLAVREFAEQ